MRDNPNYRAANIRAQAGVATVVGLPAAGRKIAAGRRLATVLAPVRPDRSCDPAAGRRNTTGDQSIDIHCNGIDIIPMECIRNGMDWYPLHWSPLHTNAI